MCSIMVWGKTTWASFKRRRRLETGWQRWNYNCRSNLPKGLFGIFPSGAYCHFQEGQAKMKEHKVSNAGGKSLHCSKKCFLRGRGEPARCDLCGIAQPTNNVPPCWPSSQLQLLLRLKIDNQRESSRESKGLLENSTAIFDSPFTAWYKIQVKSLFHTKHSVHTSSVLWDNTVTC